MAFVLGKPASSTELINETNHNIEQTNLTINPLTAAAGRLKNLTGRFKTTA